MRDKTEERACEEERNRLLARREGLEPVQPDADEGACRVPSTDALQSIALELRALRELEERRLDLEERRLEEAVNLREALGGIGISGDVNAVCLLP